MEPERQKTRAANREKAPIVRKSNRTRSKSMRGEEAEKESKRQSSSEVSPINKRAVTESPKSSSKFVAKKITFKGGMTTSTPTLVKRTRSSSETPGTSKQEAGERKGFTVRKLKLPKPGSTPKKLPDLPEKLVTPARDQKTPGKTPKTPAKYVESVDSYLKSHEDHPEDATALKKDRDAEKARGHGREGKKREQEAMKDVDENVETLNEKVLNSVAKELDDSGEESEPEREETAPAVGQDEVTGDVSDDLTGEKCG